MTRTIQQEEALFDAARNLGLPAARKAFLDQACAGDSALRARLEELLAAGPDAESFFLGAAPARNMLFNGPQNDAEQPGIPGVEETVSAATPTEAPGTRIGNYKLLQKIGEGGCGVVYMAEQERPVRRRIALKIIKLGMDTKNVVARFEAERQALALMDHPNI